MDKARFCRLWNRCAVADAVADAGRDPGRDPDPDPDRGGAVFEELAAYYREPHRFYHTGGHIDDCLERMDKAAGEPGYSDAAELAIWFHDVIYAIGAADNERRSAEWFAGKADGVLPPELIRRVETYILSTTHCEPPDDDGAKLVVDVDLSGLGMPYAQFRRDGENIRRESAGATADTETELSEAEFIRGQSGFLQKLLARERIYYTAFFHDLCEARARENIRTTLERYANGG